MATRIDLPSAVRPVVGGHDRLGVVVRTAGGTSLVLAAGNLDAASAWRLRDSLDELAEAGSRRLVVDLAHLRVVEFTAVGILIGALTRLRRREVSVSLGPPECGLYRLLRRLGATADTQR